MPLDGGVYYPWSRGLEGRATTGQEDQPHSVTRQSRCSEYCPHRTSSADQECVCLGNCQGYGSSSSITFAAGYFPRRCSPNLSPLWRNFESTVPEGRERARPIVIAYFRAHLSPADRSPEYRIPAWSSDRCSCVRHRARGSLAQQPAECQHGDLLRRARIAFGPLERLVVSAVESRASRHSRC